MKFPFYNYFITFFRTVFTSEEADLARCIGVVCNAGFSQTKAEIIVSWNICISSHLGICRTPAKSNMKFFMILFKASVNLCHKELYLRFCGDPTYISMHLRYISLFFRKIYSQFVVSCIIFLQLIVTRHFLFIQDILHNYVVINNLEAAQFNNWRPGLTWIKNFMARNRLTHKKAEMISSAWKSNTSNPFLIYDFFDQLETVSHLHPFMNILKLSTNVGKLLKLN